MKISQSLERIFLQSSSLRREKLSKRTSKAVRKARDLLKEAFDITNDHSLKISRSLEVIFLHNNQREIPIPPAPEEPKEVSFLCLFFLKLFLLFWEIVLLVFCYQNCSHLLGEKIVLVIEKTFEIRGWRQRICKNFEITRTIYSNSETSEQFLVTECVFNLFLEV